MTTSELRPALIGSLPGTDFGAALRLVINETPEVMSLPELPARGVGADMVGRSAAMLSGLGVDLQPAGWRLTDHPGADQRRARALLRRDLDDLEEQGHDLTGVMKLSVAGPWTMAALVERPRGDKVIADHGARRELAESLAEGVGDLLEELRRRLPGLEWWLQVDEPMLAMVLAGQVDTASGFFRHRAVSASEVAARLTGFANLAEVSALHWCGRADWDVMTRSGFDVASIDPAQLARADLDSLAAWLESGRQVWWGAVPTALVDQLGSPRADADRLLRLWRQLGLDPEQLLPGLVTPACGLGLWSLMPALAAARQTRAVADILTQELPR